MGPGVLIVMVTLIAVPTMFVNILLPTANIHFAKNRETALRELVQQAVDNNRLSSASAMRTAINQIAVDGVQVASANVIENGQYITVDMTYRFTNLFTNEFFTKSGDLDAKTKSIRIIIDKVA